MYLPNKKALCSLLVFKGITKERKKEQTTRKAIVMLNVIFIFFSITYCCENTSTEQLFFSFNKMIFK